MKNYGLLLILALFLVGCVVDTNLSASNDTVAVPTSTNLLTQTTGKSQETEPSKTPTQQITGIPLPQPTNTEEARLVDQLGVAVEFPDRAIVVFNFDSGESRRLRDGGKFVFLDWVDNGCGLIIGDTIFDVGSVYKIDLQGNFLEEITHYDFQHIEGYIGLGVSDIYLSPSGEYIAYIVSAYEDSYQRDPNLFNLYVSRVDDPNSTIAISQNDGVVDMAWSPDGALIAFSDYDNSGILQLYISGPEKEGKVQLTNFTMPNSTIQYITWSPNLENIAFNYLAYKEEGGILENSAIIVSVQGIEKQSKTINSIEGKEFREIQNIWWEDDNVIVMDVIVTISDKTSSEMYWINTQTDAVVETVFQEDVGSFEYPWSQSIYSEGRLGLLVWPEFWVFDLEKREVIAKVEMPVDIASSWYLAPLDFPGETNCN